MTVDEIRHRLRFLQNARLPPLKTVARAAGINRKTAYNVINGKPISEPIRERLSEVLQREQIEGFHNPRSVA